MHVNANLCDVEPQNQYYLIKRFWIGNFEDSLLCIKYRYRKHVALEKHKPIKNFVSKTE